MITKKEKNIYSILGDALDESIKNDLAEISDKTGRTEEEVLKVLRDIESCSEHYGIKPCMQLGLGFF